MLVHSTSLNTTPNADKYIPINKCKNCNNEWYLQSMYCNCGEINVFQSIDVKPPTNLPNIHKMVNEISLDAKGNVSNILTQLNDYNKCTMISSMDENGNEIKQFVKDEYEYDITCKYNDYGLSCKAPPVEYLQKLLEHAIKQDKPKCLSISWIKTDDYSGHAVIAVIYPSGSVFILDPNGLSKLYPTLNRHVSFSNIEKQLNLYFNNVCSIDGKTLLHIVPQRTWCPDNNLNIRLESLQYDGSLLQSDGICASVVLIFAAMIVEHGYNPYQVQSILGKSMISRDAYTLLIKNCVSKIYPLFE